MKVPENNPRFRFYHGIIIAALAFLIYSNALGTSFHFNDYVTILENPAVKNFHNLKFIWEVFNTRFLTGLSFALNYSIGKFDAFGYHLVNLITHILAAVFVYFLALLTFKTPSMKGHSLSQKAQAVALFSALIFLAHP